VKRPNRSARPSRPKRRVYSRAREDPIFEVPIGATTIPEGARRHGLLHTFVSSKNAEDPRRRRAQAQHLGPARETYDDGPLALELSNVGAARGRVQPPERRAIESASYELRGAFRARRARPRYQRRRRRIASRRARTCRHRQKSATKSRDPAPHPPRERHEPAASLAPSRRSEGKWSSFRAGRSFAEGPALEDGAARAPDFADSESFGDARGVFRSFSTSFRTRSARADPTREKATQADRHFA